jgi:hypothetical protein
LEFDDFGDDGHGGFPVRGFACMVRAGARRGKPVRGLVLRAAPAWRVKGCIQ